jgi:poly-gamma-glutamate capsule biosynthesis protein CapA/YwtB (metallophosphatase superfamily)
VPRFPERLLRRLAAAAVATVLVGVALGACSSSSKTAAPAASSSAPNPSASPSPAAPPSFTLTATGDLLIHQHVYEQAQRYGQASGQAYDFEPMFSLVRKQISAADLAVCHVETPMSADDTNLAGYPTFNTPHELAPAIKWTGWDSCSTASNHSYDEGAAGVKATLDALDAVGVAHAGTARSAAEAAQFELHDVNGAKVALLSYTYALNGETLPAAQPWLVNLTNVPAILAAAHAARAAGATFVVVSMHWGQEYQVAPTAEQQLQAAALLGSPDVDLVLGDHVHVIQPIEKINGKYVIYGLGNFVSNQSPAADLAPSTQDGMIVTATVTRSTTGKWAVSKMQYTPTWVNIGPYTVTPVVSALKNPNTSAAQRAQLQASYLRTVGQVSSISGHADDATPDATP